MKSIRKSVLLFVKNPRKLISKKYMYEYILLFILLVSIFFRFYNTPGRYVLDFDPTRDALINIVGEENFKFPQTGPKSGIAEFTFGPWYYYQTIIFSIITPFDYAPWIYIGITSVVTVFLYYLIGYFLEDKRLGLIIASLVAIAPAELGPITGLSNPNLIPIQTVIVLLMFILFIKKHLNPFWMIFWGLSIGIGINNHYQAVGLLFLPAIALISKRKNLILNSLLIGLGVFLSFIPLLLFNIQHDWHTVVGFVDYSKHGQTGAADRWTFYLRDFWPRFASYVLGVPVKFGYVLGGYIIIILGYAIFKKRIKPFYYLLLLAFILNVVFLRYGTSIRENYYFIYMHGFIFIFAGLAFWVTLKYKYLLICSIILILGMAYFTLKEDIRRFKSEERVLFLREHKESIVKTFPQDSFVFYSCGERSRTQTQALVFYFHQEDKLNESGRKIGIASDECRDPQVQIKFHQTGMWDFIDLESRTPEAIQEYWVKTTPGTVYETNLEWWKQP